MIRRLRKYYIWCTLIVTVLGILAVVEAVATTIAVTSLKAIAAAPRKP